MIHDMTGWLVCPYCRLGAHLFYEAIPPLERVHDDAHEHWAESRDYHCMNCDFEFSTVMTPEDYEIPHPPEASET